MKQPSLFMFSSLFVSILLLSSCNKGKNETKISSHGSSESHNMGQDCMSCHVKKGKGEGWFNVAGTVYNNTNVATFANATVKLYTGPGATGTLKYTIEVDSKGNFYTTEAIDFGSGLYPVIEGSTGFNHMSTSITTGNCISCHGSSTGKLWTE
ncbi:MAG: hypothetical protein WC044_03390 [Crocinitomicaceae bacterium]